MAVLCLSTCSDTSFSQARAGDDGLAQQVVDAVACQHLATGAWECNTAAWSPSSRNHARSTGGGRAASGPARAPLMLDLIPKPFTAAALGEKVRAVLDRA
jgi:hypothetical protein